MITQVDQEDSVNRASDRDQNLEKSLNAKNTLQVPPAYNHRPSILQAGVSNGSGLEEVDVEMLNNMKFQLQDEMEILKSNLMSAIKKKGEEIIVYIDKRSEETKLITDTIGEVTKNIHNNKFEFDRQA